MTRAGNLLLEFLPADEMFNVAEAIIRVFHRLGDYKHKQRNRLKFLVKSLGWDGFRAEFEQGARGIARRRRRRAAVRSATRRRSRTRRRRCVRALERCRSRRSRPRAPPTTVIGPGIVPQVEPRLTVQSEEFVDWSRTNVRPQKQAGFAIVIVTTVLGDLTSAQMRLLGELAAGRSATAPFASPRIRTSCSAGCAPRTSSRSTAVSRRPGCRAPAPARWPTSPAARAPSRASSR